VSELAESETQE